MNDIWNRVKQKKLRVLSIYKDEFKDVFANFGKQSHKYSSFGPFYELYLYCFSIGFHSNVRLNIDKKETGTFNLVLEWKNHHQTILKNFLTALLCEDDIRQEIEFDFFSLENKDDNYINKKVDDLICVFEEFANGGFEILKKEYDANPEEFHDFRSLYAFFNEKVQNSKRLNNIIEAD